MLWNGRRNSPCSPEQLRAVINRSSNELTQAFDSHELLLHLLNELHTDLNVARKDQKLVAEMKTGDWVGDCFNQ